MTNAKSFRCPHCNREFLCEQLEEAEKHKKECPSRFKNPQERFKARLVNQKQNTKN